MRYLFYLGHPAHFHLFKNVIRTLQEKGHGVTILIKRKDILEDLLQRSGWPYLNVLDRERGDSKVAIAWSLLERDVKVLQSARAFRPDLMIGTSAEITHVGRFLGIPSIVVNEDDHDVVPLFARMAYPLASTILAPSSCRVGKWARKTVSYEGYHELAYLHPNHFEPDRRILEKLAPEGDKYFILRFAKLTAHHDSDRSGIGFSAARKIVAILEAHGSVYITAERELEPEFERLRIAIDPLEIHSALYFAHMYVGDSQTMAAEAAVLGTPSLRFNDFVGEIGYLEELEHRFGLTFGVPTTDIAHLLSSIEALLRIEDLKERWQERRNAMLAEKIDFADMMVRLFENYPNSIGQVYANEDSGSSSRTAEANQCRGSVAHFTELSSQSQFVLKEKTSLG